jgi:hypothetical protein
VAQQHFGRGICSRGPAYQAGLAVAIKISRRSRIGAFVCDPRWSNDQIWSNRSDVWHRRGLSRSPEGAILGPFVARSAGAGFTVVPSIKSTSCLIASRTCIACIITCEKLGLTFAYIQLWSPICTALDGGKVRNDDPIGCSSSFVCTRRWGVGIFPFSPVAPAGV